MADLGQLSGTRAPCRAGHPRERNLRLERVLTLGHLLEVGAGEHALAIRTQREQTRPA